jgi:hypothetical protein
VVAPSPDPATTPADPGSFRDPANRVFVQGDAVYRALDARATAELDAVRAMPFFRAAASALRLGRNGFRLVLADVEKPEETAPVELGHHSDCCHAADQQLHEHAAGAGIQICEYVE